MNCKPNNGFTLIELMVAASIMGVIGLTILSTFASGFHVFERIQSFGGAQADILLALEEMEKDLKNTFPYLTFPFEGDTQSMIFPAVIETIRTDDDEEENISLIGRISYFVEDAIYLNEVSKGLIRVEQNYSQASAGNEVTVEQGNILAYIEDLSLEYYSYSEDEDAQDYGWVSSWSDDEGSILAGVKIAITYKDGDNDVQIERTVLIPALQKVIGLEVDEEVIGEGEEEEGGTEE